MRTTNFLLKHNCSSSVCNVIRLFYLREQRQRFIKELRKTYGLSQRIAKKVAAQISVMGALDARDAKDGQYVWDNKHNRELDNK